MESAVKTDISVSRTVPRGFFVLCMHVFFFHAFSFFLLLFILYTLAVYVSILMDSLSCNNLTFYDFYLDLTEFYNSLFILLFSYDFCQYLTKQKPADGQNHLYQPVSVSFSMQTIRSYFCFVDFYSFTGILTETVVPYPSWLSIRTP